MTAHGACSRCAHHKSWHTDDIGQCRGWECQCPEFLASDETPTELARPSTVGDASVTPEHGLSTWLLRGLIVVVVTAVAVGLYSLSRAWNTWAANLLFIWSLTYPVLSIVTLVTIVTGTDRVVDRRAMELRPFFPRFARGLCLFAAPIAGSFVL